MKQLIIFLSLMTYASFTFASEALVDTTWLADRLDDKNLLLVDLRPRDYVEYARAQGSSHTDYSKWRQPKTVVLQKELPTREHLEKLMSEMGATTESHLVLLSSGESASDLASATRIYWTLEQIGHDKKSILNGGILAYANANLPLVRGPLSIKPSDYKISRMKSDQINADQILNNKGINLVDTRSKAEHLGIYQGAPDERAGTIPGSSSLPYDWFTQNGSGWFADKENLKTLVNTLDLDPKKNTVAYCHTGHRASLNWFVLHEILGKGNTILYDASTREWASRADLPIEQQITITH